MKQFRYCCLLTGALLVAVIGCKKPKDKPVIQPGAQTTTLADTLRAACTAPFVGHGDSSGVYLPTAFSPNGDGMNDYYRPIAWVGATGNYFSSVSVKAYDTLGNLVYQSTNTASTGWDGTDQTTKAPSMKYKFYVRIKYTTAHGISDSGYTYVYMLSGTACLAVVAADTAKYVFPDQYDLHTGYRADWASYEVYCH